MFEGKISGVFGVEKFNVSVDADKIDELVEFWGEVKNGRLKPHEVLSASNLLVSVGLLEIWDIVKGASVLHFNATDTRIGIGDSSQSPSTGDTDLVAAVNKTYKTMDSGWPKTRTDDVNLGYGVFQTKATFGSSDANYAWNEAVVRNANAGSLKIICRATTGWGTKSMGSTWVATHTITLS